MDEVLSQAAKFGDADQHYRGRFLYIADWLPPDFGAVGQYALIFARDLAASGADVTLAGLSTTGNHETRETIGRGRYREFRIAAKPYDKANMLSRLLWTASINTKLIFRLWPIMRDAETILFTGSPPLFLHWIAPANLLLRKNLIYRITDFHPECSIAERGRSSLLLNFLYRLTLFWRRRVSEFEVLGHDQAQRLAEIGIPPQRIHIRPNPSPVAIAQNTVPLARPVGSEGKVLMLYSGNWGRAHDYLTFLKAYERHHRNGRADVILWLNAVGSHARELSDELTAHDLPFFTGAPVPLDQLANLLVTADVHLITLSDAFVGFVLPSKMHGCVASGRPILFIGSDRSDVHRVCSEQAAGRYHRVEVGDISACARALDNLGANMPVKNCL